MSTYENKAPAYGDTRAPTGTRRKHVRHEGIMVLPTASGAVRQFRMHDAYEMEHVEIIASEYGVAPKIPAFTDVDDNRTFIGGNRETLNAVPVESGHAHLWYVAANYSYVLASPVGLAAEFPGARLYMDTTVVADPAQSGTVPCANIPTTSFVTGLLGKPSV